MVFMARIGAGLLVLGIYFGYLEAGVVVYLRAIYDPIRQRIHPERRPNDLFPLITQDQLLAAGPENERRLIIELGREVATIAMLAAFGLVMGRNFNERMAAFAIAFGLWDISFYVFLKMMIHWPESLNTWDILFLIPLPWIGPVLAPVLVSAALIVCGLISLSRGGIPARPRHWLAMIAGGLLVILSFMWDFRNTMAGGSPNPFNWPLFLLGEALGVIGFLAALRTPGSPGSRTLRGS